MRLIYKGFLYEENYHHNPTSYFNLDFIKKVHDLSESATIQIYRIQKQNGFKFDTIHKLNTDPIIYVMATEEIENKYELMSVKKFKDGYVIQINRKIIKNEIDELFFISIMHEVVHIIQKQNGSYGDISTKFKDNPEAYINDPVEFNAYLASIVSFITYSKNRIEELKTKTPDEFIKIIINYLGMTEENFTEYMTIDNRNKFYEICGLILAKIKQGYFSQFSLT